MKSNTSAFFVIIILFTLFSCQREPAFEQPPTPPTPPLTPVVENVSVIIKGRIIDENKIPLQNVVVKAGNSTVQTDINGNFRLQNVVLNKNLGLIEAEKQGYYNGFRTIVLKANSTHYTELQLIPKTAVGTFSAGAGAKINIPSGGSIDFPAAGIINSSNNTTYSGNVSVAAFHINPADPDFERIMPGDLRALNTSNQERVLQSFGMLAVELTGASGEKLNMAAGKTATLSFPIPTSMLTKAPQTIPLWFFDEKTGYWKEEGIANKQGNNYVGTVSHFSFWNVDVPYSLIDFEAIIKDQNGNVIPNTKVKFKIEGDEGNTSGSGYTDSTGYVTGKIPANTKLQLIVNNTCGNVAHTSVVGPFNNNTNLGTITISNTGANTFTFSGSINTCPGTSFTSGFVNININGRNYRTSVTDGNYSLSLTECISPNSTATITGYETTTNKVTDTVVQNLGSNTTYNNNLLICTNTAARYINFKINSINYTLIPPADSITTYRQSSTTNINAYTLSAPNRNFYLTFTGTASTGTFPISQLIIYTENGTYVAQENISVIITEYGNTSQFITGSFNGNVKDSMGTSVFPINANFRVKRDY